MPEKKYSKERYEERYYKDIKRDVECPISFYPVPEHNDEEFKPVSNLAVETILPIYQVSNYGRVFDTYHGKYLDTTIVPIGHRYDDTEPAYASVSVLYDAGEDKDFRFKKAPVAKLVGAEFLQSNLDNPFEGFIVKHISDDITDNRIQNLKFRKKYKPKPKRESSLTEEEATEVYKLIRMGFLPEEVHAKTGFPIKEIEDIRFGRTHKNVSDKYIYYTVIDRYMNNPLPEKTVRKVCKLLEEKKSIIDVSYATGVSIEVIYPILARMQYLNISKDYDWD